MISRVETILDDLTERDLRYFEAVDCPIVRDLLACPTGEPHESHHKWYVVSDDLGPEHVRWLKEDLEGWVVLEKTGHNGLFCFWFTSETDAVAFEHAFN